VRLVISIGEEQVMFMWLSRSARRGRLEKKIKFLEEQLEELKSLRHFDVNKTRVLISKKRFELVKAKSKLKKIQEKG